MPRHAPPRWPASDRGTLKVRWWGPGPLAARNRARKSLDPTAQGMSTSIRARWRSAAGPGRTRSRGHRSSTRPRGPWRSGARRPANGARRGPRGRGRCPRCGRWRGRPSTCSQTGRRGTGLSTRTHRSRYVRSMDFRTSSVVDLANRVRAGELTAAELVDHSLGRISAAQPHGQRLRRRRRGPRPGPADVVDATVAAGGDPGPLAGIPIGVKDLEDAAAMSPPAARRLADHPPATADSILVGRLVAAGCVVVGKTNTPELGWKAHTENPLFGATLNPWNLEHTAGGSSGGSRRRHRLGHGAARHRLRRRRFAPDPVVGCGLRGTSPRWAAFRRGAPPPPTGQTCRRRAPWPVGCPTSWRPSKPWSGPIRRTCGRYPDPRRRGSPRSTTPDRRPGWRGHRRSATPDIDDEVLDLCRGAVDVLADLGCRGRRGRHRLRRPTRSTSG